LSAAGIATIPPADRLLRRRDPHSGEDPRRSDNADVARDLVSGELVILAGLLAMMLIPADAAAPAKALPSAEALFSRN
jgi:hypothetical protein